MHLIVFANPLENDFATSVKGASMSVAGSASSQGMELKHPLIFIRAFSIT
jgi:hypothetical protein